jgi:hypothetical protein
MSPGQPTWSCYYRLCTIASCGSVVDPVFCRRPVLPKAMVVVLERIWMWEFGSANRGCFGLRIRNRWKYCLSRQRLQIMHVCVRLCHCLVAVKIALAFGYCFCAIMWIAVVNIVVCNSIERVHDRCQVRHKVLISFRVVQSLLESSVIEGIIVRSYFPQEVSASKVVLVRRHVFLDFSAIEVVLIRRQRGGCKGCTEGSVDGTL